jgi:signal transduction histidine kinase
MKGGLEKATGALPDLMSQAMPAPRLPSAPALLAVAALGVVIWATVPFLGHSSGSVVPQPVHGIVLVILLLARGQVSTRPSLPLLLWATMAAAAMLGGGDPRRALGAMAVVVLQSLLIIRIFERLGGRDPLESVASLVRLSVATIAGSAPVIMVVTALVRATRPEVVPDHSALAWWLMASTSGMIFAPVLLAFRSDAWRSLEGRWRRAEFLALFTLFAVSLVDVFSASGIGLGVRHLPHAVTSLPFLVWAALRFSIVGTAITSVLLIVITLGATAAGSGAYIGFADNLPERLRVASYFMAVAVGSVMLFAVALSQRAAEERRTEAAYAQLRAIVEGAGDLIAAVDTELRIVAVNPAWVAEWRRLSGDTVRTGMSMEEALKSVPYEAEGSVGRWRRALDGDAFVYHSGYGDPAVLREEYEITYSPVRDGAGQIVGAAQVVRNVTARRRREQEEAEARRLESVGRLAGGVAHDFNNLMTAVTGYTSLVAGTLDVEDPRRADLAEIERAAVRAGELTQQLLAFARRQVVEPKVVNAGELVNGFSRLLAPLLGRNIMLVVHAARDLRPVRIDPTQFEQVVMNLAINARDAMGGSGRLLIETINDEREGVEGVSLVVRDSGTGMSEEVQQRIFEPFFTTKPLGQGTGLGLPTVHGIVHQAGGHIGVESVPGVGTTFRIFFPAVSGLTPLSSPAVKPRSAQRTP